MGALVLLVVVGSSIWVGCDAQARDFSNHSFASGTTQWVFGSLLLWIIVFPVYLVARGRVPLRAGKTAAGAAGAPPAVGGMAVKACPDCAEQVRAAARKCRFCGYRFMEEIT
jgi:hypothetical protein